MSLGLGVVGACGACVARPVPGREWSIHQKARVRCEQPLALVNAGSLTDPCGVREAGASGKCVPRQSLGTSERVKTNFNNQHSLFANHQSAAGIFATDYILEQLESCSTNFVNSARESPFSGVDALHRHSPLIRPSGTFSPARSRGRRTALSGTDRDCSSACPRPRMEHPPKGTRALRAALGTCKRRILDGSLRGPRGGSLGEVRSKAEPRNE